jgi:hypothetical protein
MRKLLRSQRWLLVLVVVAVITGLVFGGITLASASKSLSLDPNTQPTEATPTPWPDPPEYEKQPVSERTFEEELAWRQQALEENEKSGGYEYRTCGLGTMGSTIYVKGKIVNLPGDAYVQDWVGRIDCMVGYSCPQAPLYIIARGNSMIELEQGSGKILYEDIALGEEGTFDFLKEALR